MFKIVFSTTIFFILISCASKPTNLDELLRENGLSNKEKIELIFKNDYLKETDFIKEEIDWLADVYKSRDNEPIFCEDTLLTKKGEETYKSISNSLCFGIPAKRLKMSKSPKTATLLQELYMCINLSRIMYDLNNGFFDFKTKKLKVNKLISPAAFNIAINLSESKTFDNLLLTQGPTDTNYRYLATNTYKFCKKYPQDSTIFNLKNIKKEPMNGSSRLAKAMISKGYLLKEKITNQKVVEALKVFQKDNGLSADGIINTNVIKALEESNVKKMLRAAISLDKIRQSNIHQEKYIRINIPEYLLYFYSNNSLKSVHRIVVGKTSNQTPELTSKITGLVIYPYWNVPASICKNEALPSIKKDVEYLNRNHYKIYNKEREEVDPTTVDWENTTTFPYALVQDPGSHNSLGVIKFVFRNSFNVYVHDTPSKSLFKKSVRNFSHGCMRCDKPIDLGKIIIKNDKKGTIKNRFKADSIDKMIKAKKNRIIQLKTSIPIFVYYQTVVADRNNIFFYLDIYARDEEYLKLLIL